MRKKNKKESDWNESKYLERISERLKLPSDILVGAPIVIVTGYNQLYIENYRTIIEYNGEIIRVQTKYGRISIEGEKLIVDYYSMDEMRISGIIRMITYC